MTGLSKIKQMARNALPPGLQIPAKYWYLKARGMLEPEMDLLPLLGRPGSLAIDIGANFGIYSYALRRLGCRVAMFEPNPAIAAALSVWAGSNGSVHAVALSDRAGTAALHIPRDASGVEHDAAASLMQSDAGLERTLPVPTATLDSFGFAEISFIKIDVEGHEAAVLAGAQSTIRTHTPAMLIEIEQRHSPHPITQTFETITAMGYQGWFLCDGRLLPLAGFRPDQHQSSSAIGQMGARYCNNFLFLAAHRVAGGEYAALLARAEGV